MKTTIDIEKLLQWAMREELPKGQAVAATPWDIITRYCALGVRVDVSGHGDGLGFVFGEPCSDALRVAEAVRGVDVSKGFDSMDDALMLFGDLAGIAGDAARMILLSSFDPRSLVLSHATLGTRPKWKFEQPAPCQMFAPSINGKPRAIVYGVDADGDLIEIKANRGRKAMRELYDYAYAPRSPLHWHDPSPLHVGECRAEYIVWHSALVALADALAGALDGFDVLPPSASALPWIDGERLARVLVGADLGAVDADGDLKFDGRLQPKRGAIVGRPIESPIEAESVASYLRASRTKLRKPAAV